MREKYQKKGDSVGWGAGVTGRRVAEMGKGAGDGSAGRK
jgi:hypothetical protein